MTFWYRPVCRHWLYWQRLYDIFDPDGENIHRDNSDFWRWKCFFSTQMSSYSHVRITFSATTIVEARIPIRRYSVVWKSAKRASWASVNLFSDYGTLTVFTIGVPDCDVGLILETARGTYSAAAAAQSSDANKPYADSEVSTLKPF